MTPLISYYGGKQRMARHIIKLIPQHTAYVEPFCGGAAVLFSKPYIKLGHIYREVINDLDSNLINMYRCFQNEETEQKLLKKLKFILYSKDEYEKATNILKKKSTDTINVEKAWAYYVTMIQSFSNHCNAWGYNLFEGNSAYAWGNKIKSLEKAVNRFSCVFIEHLDAVKVIKKWDSPHTFFYCDPPYIGREQKYNTEEYTEEDLKKLVGVLNECKGSFILSGYDTDIVPKEWERFEFNAVCSSFNPKNNNINNSRIEIVWRRFNTEKPRKIIQKFYDRREFNYFVRHPDFKSEITLLQDSA